MLSPYRVLDLTDEKGFLCGKMLADLGADVIKIEKPGGDPSRNREPFYQDIPHPEKSLYWWAYNSNKRGITLDIETSDGKELLKRLAKTADFVIESFSPGHLDKLGICYSMLSKINPGIILVSITPFGQEGPYRDYKGSDIVATAMSGYLYLVGDPDRPPVRIGLPQSYLHAGADAAAAALIALYHRRSTGEGQHIDVSMQQVMAWCNFDAHRMWDMAKLNVKRKGGYRHRTTSNVVTRVIRPTKDGHAVFWIVGGVKGAPGVVGSGTMPPLIDWMESEGIANDYVRQIDWRTFDYDRESQEGFNRIEEALRKFFLSHTKAELIAGALKRLVMLWPINTMKELCESPQLKARGFWKQIKHDDLDITGSYPGAFFKANQEPEKSWRRAPHIGEHNVEVYEREIGLSRKEMLVLKQGGVI